MRTFGERLRCARKETGLTQKQVAELLHLHRSTYTKYEQGSAEPSLATFKELCQILQTSPDRLLGWPES